VVRQQQARRAASSAALVRPLVGVLMAEAEAANNATHLLTPRNGWQKVEASGLVYHTPNGQRYWMNPSAISFNRAKST
jgi:hypothetical protein